MPRPSASQTCGFMRRVPASLGGGRGLYMDHRGTSGAYCKARVRLENKEHIGKVGEIFGQLRDFYFPVKLSENRKAPSFKKPIAEVFASTCR